MVKSLFVSCDRCDTRIGHASTRGYFNDGEGIGIRIRMDNIFTLIKIVGTIVSEGHSKGDV